MYDHEQYEDIMFAIEQTFFHEAEETGYFKTDFCIIMHPKHKPDVAGLIDKIPIIFSRTCTEDKFYVATDPCFVKNVKELLEKR